MSARQHTHTHTHTRTGSHFQVACRRPYSRRMCFHPHTQSLVFLSTTECQTLPYIYAHRQAISLPTYNSPSVRPFPLSPHSSQLFLPSIPPFTPARPTARSHTSITPRTHTQTHVHKEWGSEGARERGSECDREEDKKGGGESRFHATLSTG